MPESPPPPPDSRPVLKRLLLPLMSVLLVLLGAFLVLEIVQHRGAIVSRLSRELAEVPHDFRLVLNQQSDALGVGTVAVAQNQAIVNALAAGDVEGLLASSRSLFERLRHEYGVTHFYFHGPDRVNLLRVHKPSKSGDLINRFTTREAERSEATSSGIELGPLGTFTLRVVRPIVRGTALIGYVELGKEIEEVLAGLHERPGIELALLVSKDALTRAQWEDGLAMLGREGNWDLFPKDVVIYQSGGLLSEFLDRRISHGISLGMEAGHFRADGRDWRVAVEPVLDVSGSLVSRMVVARDVSAEEAGFTRSLVRTTLTVVAILAGLFVFVFVLLRRVDAGLAEKDRVLAESEQRFIDILYASDDAILLIDGETFVDCNEATATMLGYDARPEFLMQHPSALSPPTQPYGQSSLDKANTMIATGTIPHCPNRY